MGLSTFVGSFLQKTSTGNQATTGVGFQPKVIFFWATIQTADGSGADTFGALGVAVSTSNRYCMDWRGADVISRAVAFTTNAKCIAINNQTIYITTLAAADLVSMDADGFTLNWTTADATARVINFLAIGGTDLTNVIAGSETTATTNTTKATTGVGFQPTCLILFFPIQINTETNQTQAPSKGFLGFASSTSLEASSTYFDAATAAPSNTDRYQRTNNIIAMNNAVALAIEGTLASFDSDGFTINYTATSGTAQFFYYVAMAGPQFKVGNFNQATSTGNQATTGVGFQPKAIILQSFDNVAATTIQTNLRHSEGAGVSSSQRFSVWTGSLDNNAGTVRNNSVDRANIMKMMTEGAAGTPTTQAVADLVSLDADGFTLNWTTADATARQILYLAIGPALPSTASARPSYLPLLGVA